MYPNNTASISGTATYSVALAFFATDEERRHLIGLTEARGPKGFKKVIPQSWRDKALAWAANEGPIVPVSPSQDAGAGIPTIISTPPLTLEGPSEAPARAPKSSAATSQSASTAQPACPSLRRVPERLRAKPAARDAAIAAKPQAPAMNDQPDDQPPTVPTSSLPALDLPQVSFGEHTQPPAGTDVSAIFGVPPVAQPSTSRPAVDLAAAQRSSRPPVHYGKHLLDRDSMDYCLNAINQRWVMHTSGKGPQAYDTTRPFNASATKNREAFAKHIAKHIGSVAVVAPDGSLTGEKLSAGDVWWDCLDGKRVVDVVVMEPTDLSEAQDVERRPEVLNRWHVLKETRRPPATDAAAAQHGCQMLYDHLLYLAGGDKVPVTFALNWLAELWQHPGIKLPTALYFLSEFTGTGKSILGRLFRTVFGGPLVASLEGSKLERDFDDAILGKQLVVVHEVSGRRNYEKLKHQISELYTVVEGKGVAATEAMNTQHFIFTGNRLDGLPAMREDRRLVIFLCRERAKSADYYARLNAWIDGEGPSHLAWLLENWQFTESWNPHGAAPQTNAAREVQRAARGELANSIEEMILERRPPFARDLGRVREILPQLRTIHPDLDERRLVDILKVLGHEQIRCGNSGETNPLYRYWPFRNDAYWSDKPNAVLRDHLEKGAVPFDYPNDQGDNHD